MGYDKHGVAGKNTGNSRNGASGKRLKGDFGEIELETPRDRNGEFESRLIKKLRRDSPDSMRKGHLEEIYEGEVSPALVSDIAEWVMEQAKAWQNRPLEAILAALSVTYSSHFSHSCDLNSGARHGNRRRPTP
jgi:putative transposase